MSRTSWSGTLSSISLAAIASVGLLACQGDEEDLCTDKTKSAVDADTDFTLYETFAILAVDGGGLGGLGGMSGADVPDKVTANLEVANETAAAELTERGLRQVDPSEETPDLWIASAAATEREIGTYWACVPGYYWWGWYPYWDPCAWMAPIPFRYTEGTVLVALVDADTEEPVFGGTLQGVLECSNDLDGRVESGVERIFDDYPVPPVLE